MPNVSELQIALLLIAGVVLAGLYLAGKWQERRLLRRLGEELGGGVGDALLGGAGPGRAQPGSYARAPAASRRIEPRLQSEAAAPAAPANRSHEANEANEAAPAAPARRSEWVEDPLLDCVLELRCARPVDGVSFIDAAVGLTGSQWPMPVWFVVWDARAQQWVHPDRFGYYSEALAAIQLAKLADRLTVERPSMRRVQGRPRTQGRAPVMRNLAQHRKPRTHVFATLVIVRGRGEHRVRKALRTFEIRRMKLRDRQSKLARV